MKYKPITNKIWDGIVYEGLDEEQKAYKKTDWEYVILPLSKSDKKGLMDFDYKIVEKYNMFDYQLKEKYKMKYIDLIDYDKGNVYIVRVKGAD